MLFIGEAPGISEDTLGVPFIGPAGKLLDQIVDDALGVCSNAGYLTPSGIRLGFTNLVACIPMGEDGTKTNEPPEEAIMACKGRLAEMMKLVKPQIIICVGDLSHNMIQGRKKKPSILPPHGAAVRHIVHPAAILRSTVGQTLMIKRCVAALWEASLQVKIGKQK